MTYFLYVIAALVGLIAFLSIISYIREYAIRRNRKNDKTEDFFGHFVDMGIPRPLVLSVYTYLQKWTAFDDFPVRPQDDIGKIYGIVGGDHDDLIIEIAEINNLIAPPNSDHWQKPLDTVEDVIRFIASFPKKDSGDVNG